MLNRRSQRTFDRPAKPHALQQGVRFHSPNVRPLGKTSRRPLECQQVVFPTVSALLGACCPAAILRAVVAIVVDAINRMLRGGASPHVQEKHCEVFPSIADSDAASTVVHVLGRGRVAATGAHPLPDDVLRCTAQAVNRTCLAARSTVAAFSTAQIACAHKTFRSARTTTKPIDLSVVRSFGQHCPPAKLLAGQVLEPEVATDRLRLSHDRSPKREVVRTAMQLQLLGRLHFTSECSSGAARTCSSF